MQRPRCEQEINRPSRSRAWPFSKFEGARKTLRPPASLQRMTRLFGRSLNSNSSRSPNQTGPSHHRKPSASISSGAFGRTKALKRGSQNSKASMPVALLEAAGLVDRRLHEKPRHHHGAGLAPDRAREMALAPVAGPRVLVLAEHQFARAHLDPAAVHGLHEPAPG